MIDTVRSPALELVPAAPREPGPRARKLVFGYPGILRVRLILGVVFTLVGGLFAVIFGWGTPVDAAIDLAGSRRVQGRVVSAALDRQTRINGRHPTEVRFDYDVDGRAFQGSPPRAPAGAPCAPSRVGAPRSARSRSRATPATTG